MGRPLSTTCKHGHELAGENLRLKERHATQYAHSSKVDYVERECAECHRQHNRDYWHRKGKERRAKRAAKTPLTDNRSFYKEMREDKRND